MCTIRSKICSLKIIKGPTDVLVISTFNSSNNPMLVNTLGKSRLESEVSSCGDPSAVNMSYMLDCSHIFDAMQIELSQYLKIIQGWSMVILLSTMGMKFPFFFDVELHCVVKCGILEVTMNINDR